MPCSSRMKGSLGVLSSSAIALREEDASRAVSAPPMNSLLCLLMGPVPLVSLICAIEVSLLIIERVPFWTEACRVQGWEHESASIVCRGQFCALRTRRQESLPWFFGYRANC